MPAGVYVATRLAQPDALALEEVCARRGTTTAHELRRAVDAHLRAEHLRRRVEAMNDRELVALLAAMEGDDA